MADSSQTKIKTLKPLNLIFYLSAPAKSAGLQLSFMIAAACRRARVVPFLICFQTCTVFLFYFGMEPKHPIFMKIGEPERPIKP
ncbi:hypothetical protein [Methanimicrococcus hongohii]|uniref:hypothetical protein n=1 Tax=Methanimicrococcus hongohii TaxID=3028295 RepID=UPI00292FDA3F|nr:hypothetical protein [Methanimicrococcus sp. Hf6]